ncbi:MAG TPA: hypothetical protein VGW11_02170 [Solirubrobacteraceae bacterium]|nr:hypothetical protein [Solirubrobacteraceae bacterium]
MLFAVYAATLAIPAFQDADVGGDEPHHLLTAESIVTDGDIDVRNQYAEQAYTAFYPYLLEPRGVLTQGRRHEPLAVGFTLLIAPAYALGGALGVGLLLAAISALAFVLAAALARRVVPEPWASGAALACGLSPPALAYSTAVLPEMAAGALLAGAALLALQVREEPVLRFALPAAVLLSLAPWLSIRFAPAALVIALALVRWLLRRLRRFQAFFAGEMVLFSAVLYVTINQALYGGPVPQSAATPGTGAFGEEFPLGYLERSYRIVALWVDRDYGVLRWAPVVALAFWGLWLLYRSRRERLALAVGERIQVEVAALLCALACAAQVAMAVFLAATMFGFWFPGRHLVAAFPLAVPLVAWGLRHAPRVGGALVILTLGASAWLVVELRLEARGWIAPASDAPLGPLTALLPDFGTVTMGRIVAMTLAGVATAGLLGREWWRARNDPLAGPLRFE